MHGEGRGDETLAERLAAIVESSNDAIIGKSLDFHIISWNPAAERLYGWTAEEAIGQPVSLFVLPEREHELPAALERLKAGGRVATIETRRRRKDGSRVDVAVTISPIRNRAGELVGLSGIDRDVTLQRRAVERTARLLEVTTTLAGALTADAVVRASVNLGVRAMDADAGVLVLVDGDRVRLAASTGYDEDYLASFKEFPLDAPFPLADAIRTGQLIALETPRDYEEHYGGRGPLLLEDTKASIAVPLTTEGKPFGALGLRFTHARTLQSDDRDYVRSLGGQCAIALERARLFEAERDARERLQFLSRAGEALAGSLDVDTILSTIAEAAVPYLADWCGVTVVQDDGDVRRFGIQHVDPAKKELARTWWEDTEFPHERAMGAPNVIRTGRAELQPVVDFDQVVAFADRDEAEVLRELGLVASMVVPLVARGRILGAITFVSGPSGRHYTKADLELASDLARRGALAADNARLFAEKSHIAQKLQESLLPQLLPSIPRLDIAARYVAAGEGAEVGGDFYDMFSIGSESWAVVIGDVCGKGADAAGITALARYTIRAVAPHSDAACDVLAELNDALVRQNPSPERFLTAAFGILSVTGDHARLTFCLAGHPRPLVVRRDGTVDAAGTPGTLLGVFPRTELSDTTVDLGPGDMVVLYTDGVTEARNGRGMFGEERLRDTLAQLARQPASHVAAALARAVAQYRTAADGDDMAVLVLRLED